MPGLLLNATNQFDGVVGGFDTQTAPAVVTGEVQPILWVNATGDGISDSAVLAEDLRLLINEFVYRPGERRERSVSHPVTPGDIEIATHGLNLDPASERELHRLIRERIREHMSHKETKQ